MSRRTRKPRGAVEPPRVQPLFADDGEQNIAAGDRFADVTPEVHARRNAVDVDKDVTLAKSLPEPKIDQLSDRLTILASVANEDARISWHDFEQPVRNDFRDAISPLSFVQI